MKEQNKASGKELNKMDTSNLPHAKFKILVIRMLNGLRRSIEAPTGYFNKETGKHKNGDRNHKKNQSEMNNMLTEIKNTLEEPTVELKKQRMKSGICKIRKQKIPNQKSKQKNTWDNFKHINI